MNERSGTPVAQRRRHGDDRDVEAREARRIGGRAVSRLERAPQLLAAHVLDVGTARCERLDPARSGVVARNGEPELAPPASRAGARRSPGRRPRSARRAGRGAPRARAATPRDAVIGSVWQSVAAGAYFQVFAGASSKLWNRNARAGTHHDISQRSIRASPRNPVVPRSVTVATTVRQEAVRPPAGSRRGARPACAVVMGVTLFDAARGEEARESRRGRW